ncbi:hypothetical protein [Streptomyces sp. NPDC005876]|uniref:hypothetical protein n=1 Tax=unclassified Streptomyces TaxID=2593676 RepID=UPI00340CD1E1
MLFTETLREKTAAVDTPLLEELVAAPEAAVSDAPAYRPACAGHVVWSPKEPKDPECS